MTKIASFSEAEIARAEAPADFLPIDGPAEFSQLIGPIFQKTVNGEVRRGLRLADKHTNRAGIAHGGLLLSLIDTALGHAVRQSGQGAAVTVHMTTDFIGPGRNGEWLEAAARVTRKTSSVTFAEAEIRVRHRIIMTASGIFQKIDPR